MTPYTQKVSDLQEEIFREDYYSNRYSTAVMNAKVTPEQIKAGDVIDNKLYSILFDFWCLLPDSPAIRCSTFYKLCELLEE